jgi:hypothetical protein
VFNKISRKGFGILAKKNGKNEDFYKPLWSGRIVELCLPLFDAGIERPRLLAAQTVPTTTAHATTTIRMTEVIGLGGAGIFVTVSLTRVPTEATTGLPPSSPPRLQA